MTHHRMLRLAMLATCCTAIVIDSARAHAPISRGLVLSADEQAMVVRLPGFGFVVRPHSNEPFAYACDALFDIEPTETAGPMWLRGDGTLLVGTEHGARTLTERGCPAGSSEGLPDAPVTLLAASDDEPQTLYAVSDEVAPRIHLSTDGGAHFAPQSMLPEGSTATGLVASPEDADTLYLSWTHDDSSTLAVSTNGGSSFESLWTMQGDPVSLLQVEGGELGRAWAASRDVTTRKISILVGQLPELALRPVLQLDFFGGFALDDQTDPPTVWVGDEGGSVFRSIDGGQSFVDVQPSMAVACLQAGADAIWACTPGSTRQPAVETLRDAGSMREVIVALRDVDRLVECEGVDVEHVCAGAWVEWERDVRLLTSPNDAGSRDAIPVSDAATAPDAMAPDVQDPPPVSLDGMDVREGLASTRSDASASGCAIAPDLGAGESWTWTSSFALAFALALACRTLVHAAHPGRLRVVTAKPEPDDAALVDRARRGDVDAFAALYDRHAPIVLALGQRLLSTEDAAEDLLHDVFIEAWRAVRSYDPSRSSVRTWLLVRARSRALDRLRGRARERDGGRELGRIAAAAHPSRGSGGDARLELAVRQALDTLDADVRETVELTYYSGMTANEVAVRMRVPTGTVRSRLSRGLDKLGALLRGRGGPHDR